MLVFCQATAEDYIGLAIGEGFVFCVKGGVDNIVHGIVRLHAVVPFR